jgi:hypothetical protein
MITRRPTSVVLHDLIGAAPGKTVTLGWLMGRLGDRSFGIVLILLALLGLLPGVSAFAGVLLAVPAFQMMPGASRPCLPSPLRLSPVPDAAARPGDRPDCPGATLPGAGDPSALDDSVRGDEAGRRLCRAVAGRKPAYPRSTEQRPARPPDHPDCIRLSGRGRCATVRLNGGRPDLVRSCRSSHLADDKRDRHSIAPLFIVAPNSSLAKSAVV